MEFKVISYNFNQQSQAGFKSRVKMLKTFIFVVNLEKGSVCELPNYPGTNETGTVVLALLTEHNDRPRIAACGSWTDEKDTQEPNFNIICLILYDILHTAAFNGAVSRFEATDRKLFKLYITNLKISIVNTYE